MLKSFKNDLNSWQNRRERLLLKMKNASWPNEWNNLFDELKKLDSEVCEDSGDRPCGNCYGCVREGVGPF